MDQHVPASVTAGLRRRGIDVLTANEDGAADWNDEQLLERATSLERVLFSQDVDLLSIANDWLATSREFSGLVYGHQLGITVGKAVADLELIAVVLDAEELWNRIEFIPID
jgi:hypothetical protein